MTLETLTRLTPSNMISRFMSDLYTILYSFNIVIILSRILLSCALCLMKDEGIVMEATQK